jgi:hypothetical protein
MDRFDSDPLSLSPAVRSGEFSAADLVFYDVDHTGGSFQALVFFNNPDVGVLTPRELDLGFAGSFVIFGHGGCSGDEGHCEVPSFHKDPFDNRPLHALTPQTKLVDVSDALQRVREQEGDLRVTVLPIVPGAEDAEGPETVDALFFSAMRLLPYD